MVRFLSRLVLVLVAVAGGAAAGQVLWSPAGALPPPDTAYTAIAPCVVFDSRATQGATGGFAGPVNGNQTVTYQLTGAFPAGQGGGNTTCGIPAGADAVEINVVAVNALNEGNLRVTDGTPSSTGGVVTYNNLTPKLNTSNSAIIPLSATGAIAVTPNCGAGCTADSTEVRGVVLGYFTDSLAQRVAALEAKLQDVTRIANGVGGQDTLRFSGMNVQIVDGTDETQCNDADTTGFEACNGQGNLIVGYAENPTSFPRTGSHNLVGGSQGGWSSFGGAVFGEANWIANDWATVTGGDRNQATGVAASVSGGHQNIASGEGSAVTGGRLNTASGERAAISGGDQNKSLSFYSSVTGGSENVADGVASTVNGGLRNHAGDDFCDGFFHGSTVSGGQQNSALGCLSTVSGGANRTTTGPLDWRAGELSEDS